MQLGLGEAPANRVGPPGDGVVLAEVLGHPVVGQLGSNELLDAGHLDRHVDRLVGALRRRRERALVARRDADELVVEVVGHPALTDLVGPVIGVEPRHGFVVAGRRQIDDDVVADGRRPIDVAERPEPLQLRGKLGLDLVVGHGDRRQLDAQAPVAGHVDLGAHLERGVEGHRAVLAAAGDLHVGRFDDVDLVFAHGLGEVLGDGVVERLLAGRGEADAGLEDTARHLAGAEPGKPDLLGDLAERPVDVPVELGLVDGDRELDLVALDFLQRRIHRGLRLARRCLRWTGGSGRSAASDTVAFQWE